MFILIDKTSFQWLSAQISYGVRHWHQVYQIGQIFLKSNFQTTFHLIFIKFSVLNNCAILLIKTMTPFIIDSMNLRFSLLLFLTTESIYLVNCLPLIETTEGIDSENNTIRSERNVYQISSDDRFLKWVPLRECPLGNANLMRHINVGLKEGAPNHIILHDALQFNIDCPDGKSTEYTVEFAQTDVESADVVRRFGFYKKIARIYKEAKIEFNVTELFELTSTHRDYNLNTFNSQVYTRQTFLKIVDQMCVKLGFYSDDDSDEDMEYADGPKWQINQNFCRNTLVPARLDQSLLFSKYCLVFLLLIIGSIILLINIYLKYKSRPQFDEGLVSLNPNSETLPTNQTTTTRTGQTPKRKSSMDRRNSINLNYNTFEIHKH